ncbi:membrane metallo-endopeptidase-like 1-like isoform x1 protein [Lasius niger]|uniref:Membrane metallo-endopeptidase-like 1-like isoform x1 protein n=1 Tax=Lasius niger TaxID=67767 RepID=A0A0J7KC30_LASNI|nr:membrane metallo-endopeptidase-like 1-like isoform x1 protein [Lasius niger]
MKTIMQQMLDETKGWPKYIKTITEVVRAFAKDKGIKIPKQKLFTDVTELIEFETNLENIIEYKKKILEKSTATGDKMTIARLQEYYDLTRAQEATAKILDIFDDVKEEMMTYIKYSMWRNSLTYFVIQRIHNMSLRIDYPEWYDNQTALAEMYKGLEIDDNYFTNVLAIIKYKNIIKRRSFRESMHRDERLHRWLLDLLSDNPNYDQQSNVINIPAAIMQYPYFSSNGPVAGNYGAIGSIIGQLLYHSVNLYIESYFAYEDNVKWKIRNRQTFEKGSICSIKRYRNFLLNVINGNPEYIQLYENLVKDEIVAHFIGIQVASAAFQKRMSNSPELISDFRSYKITSEDTNSQSKLPITNFTQEQLFFLFNTLVLDIFDDVKEEMITYIKYSMWQNTLTNFMIQRIYNMSLRIDYPEWYDNPTALAEMYKGLEIDDNYFTNVLAIIKYKNIIKQRGFHESMHRDERLHRWLLDLLSDNPNYDQQSNVINIPAAIMQYPYFSSNGPVAGNYGAIGSIIGQLLYHSVNLYIESYFAYEDNVKWKIRNRQTFEKGSICSIKRYRNFLLNVINGNPEYIQLYENLVKDEIVAHFIGIQVASAAFQKRMSNSPELISDFRSYKITSEDTNSQSKLPITNFTQEQLFFLFNTLLLCGMHNPYDEDLIDIFRLKEQISDNLANIVAFSKAFNCPFNCYNIWQSKES